MTLNLRKYPRVKASQGFYCSGFINQTNKQTIHAHICTKILERCAQSLIESPGTLHECLFCHIYYAHKQSSFMGLLILKGEPARQLVDNADLSWNWSALQSVFVLKAGPSWVKLNIHE